MILSVNRRPVPVARHPARARFGGLNGVIGKES